MEEVGFGSARARARKQVLRVPWEWEGLPPFLPADDDLEAVLRAIDYEGDPDLFSVWARGEWIFPGNERIPGRLELVIELKLGVGDADIWVGDFEPADIDRRPHRGGD